MIGKKVGKGEKFLIIGHAFIFLKSHLIERDKNFVLRLKFHRPTYVFYGFYSLIILNADVY